MHSRVALDPTTRLSSTLSSIRPERSTELTPKSHVKGRPKVARRRLWPHFHFGAVVQPFVAAFFRLAQRPTLHLMLLRSARWPTLSLIFLRSEPAFVNASTGQDGGQEDTVDKSPRHAEADPLRPARRPARGSGCKHRPYSQVPCIKEPVSVETGSLNSSSRINDLSGGLGSAVGLWPVGLGLWTRVGPQ